MFKKLLIVLFLFTTFFVGNSFASLTPHVPVDYDSSKNVYKDKWEQSWLQKLSTSEYQRISDHFIDPKTGTNMSTARIQELLKDWKVWDVTRYAKKLQEWKTPEQAEKETKEEMAAASTSTETTKKETCKYDPEKDGDIRDALEHCVWGSALVQVKDTYVTGWLKDVLNSWITKIAGFLALWAIFSIAFGSLKLTLSMWEDEKIKKAKDIIKWWIIGFVAVISAGFLIAALVNLIYSLAG